jgi:hypothetical protein
MKIKNSELLKKLYAWYNPIKWETYLNCFKYTIVYLQKTSNDVNFVFYGTNNDVDEINLCVNIDDGIKTLVGYCGNDENKYKYPSARLACAIIEYLEMLDKQGEENNFPVNDDLTNTINKSIKNN